MWLLSIALSSSILVIAISGAVGFLAWRKTLMNQRRVELAEQTLDLFAQIRDAITHIRSPATFVGEGATRARSADELEEESGLLDQAYVAIERYNAYSEVFARLLSMRHRFAAHFGDDAAAPFEQIDRVRFEIFAASRKLASLWPRQGRVQMTAEEFDIHLQQMQGAEAIFWEGIQEPDTVTPWVDGIFKTMDKTCRDIINPRRGLGSYFASEWAWIASLFKRGK